MNEILFFLEKENTAEVFPRGTFVHFSGQKICLQKIIAPRWWDSLQKGFKAWRKQANPINRSYLGGGFQYFLFSPLVGEMIQFDYYFSNGLKPPTRLLFRSSKNQSMKKMRSFFICYKLMKHPFSGIFQEHISFLWGFLFKLNTSRVWDDVFTVGLLVWQEVSFDAPMEHSGMSPVNATLSPLVFK